MKEKIREIALQAGGSHYPSVGGVLLEKFADLIINECIDAVSKADVSSIMVNGLDNTVANDVKCKSVESIMNRFKE